MSKILYFPFSSGIPWRANLRIINPTLEINIWETILAERDCVIVCFGGIFETFVSLMFAEVVNNMFPKKKIYFIGHKRFSKMIKYNGLAEFLDNGMTQYILSKYPVPIFLSEDNYFYFNTKLNFYHTTTYEGNNKNYSKHCAAQQIFQNTTFKTFQQQYLPQLNHLPNTLEWLQWTKQNQFKSEEPFICVIPHTGLSTLKKNRSLRWDNDKYQEFIKLCQENKLKVIVITNEPNKYNSPTLPIKTYNILKLIKSATYLLAAEVDYLLMAPMVNEKITMIYDHIYNPYNPINHLKYLGLNNMAIKMKVPKSPAQAMEIICQKK